MKRRHFLLVMVGTPLGLAAFEYTRSMQKSKAARGKPLDEIRNNWRALLAEEAGVSVSTEPIRRSEQEWKESLSAPQFHVLRQEGTEPPFSSPLNDEKQAGVYVCAACSLPLFTSEMKFDSGTGWPSFLTHIPGHLGTKTDYKLIYPRTEYHCVRCGSHQGHIFKDGPAPTGERWCNNGLALRFLPDAK